LPEETFGQRLKRLRRESKLSSTDLASDLKITLPYYSQLEADLAVPSEELARKIAVKFNQEEEELVFLARRVPKQLDEIREKYPNQAAAYFRRVTKQK
jgi:transcriptional regulator with XRE-family HTH domain